jgi:mannose-6-phosphate isomerase
VLAGTRDGLTREALFHSFKDQAYDAVMYRYPIRAGDTVYVPGGVLHSFGPDTLIFEIQQTSDLAQSVMPYDLFGGRHSVETWDRNINAALDELRPTFKPRPNRGLPRALGGNTYTVCCAGPHFALERWALKEGHDEPSHPQRCMTVTNLGAPVTVQYPAGAQTLGHAESCILPAAIGEVRLLPNGGADLLIGYVPDIERDVVAPLRDAGYSDAQIRSLGEIPFR